MAEYNKVNIKLPGSQLNMSNFKNEYQNIYWKKFTSRVIINNSTKMLRNAFLNNTSAYLKLSRTQRSKISHCGRFLGSLLSEKTAP